MLTHIEDLPTWRAESGARPPRRIVVADDKMSADTAYGLACEGTGLLWQGDFHNARQLLQALARRIDRKRQKSKRLAPEVTYAQIFNSHRQALGQRARILAMIIVPLEGDYTIPLRRAPNLKLACSEAWGPATGERCMVSLRELLGVVGAHEWRKKGITIPALGNSPNNRIHPHYGVFSPVRGEYVDLVANTHIQDKSLAFDIGVGTGVLSAVLAKRGVRRIIATDQDERALACARDNLQRLQTIDKVTLLQTDLFPPGLAPLIVCNPPWVPARPSSPIEHAVYDQDSRMLRGFLSGLRDHLTSGGEGWLILSDLAEHLGLRSRDELEHWINEAKLQVLERLDIKPRHGKVTDETDPLHAARYKEITSLWRLAAAA